MNVYEIPGDQNTNETEFEVLHLWTLVHETGYTEHDHRYSKNWCRDDIGPRAFLQNAINALVEDGWTIEIPVHHNHYTWRDRGHGSSEGTRWQAFVSPPGGKAAYRWWFGWGGQLLEAIHRKHTNFNPGEWRSGLKGMGILENAYMRRELRNKPEIRQTTCGECGQMIPTNDRIEGLDRMENEDRQAKKTNWIDYLQTEEGRDLRRLHIENGSFLRDKSTGLGVPLEYARNLAGIDAAMEDKTVAMSIRRRREGEPDYQMIECNEDDYEILFPPVKGASGT